MTLPIVKQRADLSVVPERIKSLDSKWKKIAGLHVENNGEVGVVWLGFDSGTPKNTGSIHLYDSWVFRRGESLPVIADAIKQRGEIPLACEEYGREILVKLRDKGCYTPLGKGNVPRLCYTETEALRAVNSREILDRMQTGTFRVWDTNDAWLSEEEHYREKDQLAPLEGFPLQAATRHAFQFLREARATGARFRPTPRPDFRGIV